ncbi:hypothetical protein INS49_013386 [Diaporthe citri]|uniref:uncharacterized protein n=1 Tax=Diaporthe citri TaxID=83186 RepID=UPI001C825397|nr:uncharacterized protein INS49_013386 [Diaporthe citri]KAG6357509.1 hypothetical protein INS49_013386 [Diaporthe citri]
MTLNGTVQEVDQQLNDMHPDYMNLLNKYRESHPSMPFQDVVGSTGSMDDRPDCGYCKVCTKRWAPAGLGSTLDVIKSLDGASGRCFWYEKEVSHLYPVTGGQIFEPNGWNVIVRSDSDSC